MSFFTYPHLFQSGGCSPCAAASLHAAWCLNLTVLPSCPRFGWTWHPRRSTLTQITKYISGEMPDEARTASAERTNHLLLGYRTLANATKQDVSLQSASALDWLEHRADLGRAGVIAKLGRFLAVFCRRRSPYQEQSAHIGGLIVSFRWMDGKAESFVFSWRSQARLQLLEQATGSTEAAVVVVPPRIGATTSV